MDETLSAARKKASSPRDAYEVTKLEARAGNHGLLYVTNDKQANDAVRAGRLVTMRLEIGDVLLVEKKDSSIKGQFIGVLYENDDEGGFSRALVIDSLDAIAEVKKGKKEPPSGVAFISDEDALVVWYRNGRPA